MEMFEIGTLKRLLSNSMTRLLAFPFSGGSFTLTRTVFGPISSIVSCLEFGFTMTFMKILSSLLLLFFIRR